MAKTTVETPVTLINCQALTDEQGAILVALMEAATHAGNGIAQVSVKACEAALASVETESILAYALEGYQAAGQLELPSGFAQSVKRIVNAAKLPEHRAKVETILDLGVALNPRVLATYGIPTLGTGRPAKAKAEPAKVAPKAESKGEDKAQAEAPIVPTEIGQWRLILNEMIAKTPKMGFNSAKQCTMQDTLNTALALLSVK